jgi:hypothetical protein
MYMLLFKFEVTASVSLIYWSAMLWRAWKPNWLARRRAHSSMCLWTIFSTSFWNSLLVVEKVIGLKFWVNVGSLPGFGSFMSYASSQDFGKCGSRRQWLNKCVRCISGLLGRFLGRWFRIPPSPEAVLNFSIFTRFCMIHGINFSEWVLSTNTNRAWTVVSACRLWFSPHRSWDVNLFSKESVITLAFWFGWYVIPKIPWSAVGAFGPSLFISSRLQSLRCDVIVPYVCFPLF